MENFNQQNSESSPFLINDDDSVIHFERMKSTPSMNDDEEVSPKEQNRNLKSSVNDITAMLMGTLDRKIEIVREEKEGYLIQKTIITERKKLSSTTQTLHNIGLSTTIHDEDDRVYQRNNDNHINNQNINIKNSNVNSSQNLSPYKNNTNYSSTDHNHNYENLNDNNNNFEDNESYDNNYEEENSNGFFYSIGKLVKKIIVLVTVIFIFGVAGYVGYNYYLINKTKTDFKEIISSLDIVKKQVETCILKEGPRYPKICNDGQKANDLSWDLSDRFLNENKHPQLINIKIQEGVITASANYDHKLKGSTYIIEPILNNEGKISWRTSDNSTCLKAKLCKK